MDWLLVLFVTLLAIAGLIIVLTWLRVRLLRIGRRRDFRMEDRAAWQKRWQELEALLGEGTSHWSVAVLEADKLFDRVLKHMGLPGKDMGERLKFLTASRPELRYVWSAHLVRNRVVHETNYELNRRAATQTLATFRRALRELGVL